MFAAIAINALVVVGLFVVYFLFDSQLALAQASDSLVDVVTSSVLAAAVVIGARPRDDDHQFGHSRAEPIGALAAGVVAIVLCTEVIRSAVSSLVAHEVAVIAWPVLLLFCTKVAVKLVLVLVAVLLVRCFRTRSPALRALIVDSRNDILMGLVSVAGYFAAAYGNPSLDAYLALPCGLWIGWAGVGIVRDNIRLLMGETPSAAVMAQIEAAVRADPRVRGLVEVRPWPRQARGGIGGAGTLTGVRCGRGGQLRAQQIGTHVQVTATVLVDPRLPVREGHCIAEDARARLLAVDPVSEAHVAVDSDLADAAEPSATAAALVSRAAGGAAEAVPPEKRDVAGP